MQRADQRQRCIENLIRCAVEKYGELKARKVRPPLDQLILGVMYRHTSVRRATRALREMNRGFVDWNEVRISSVEEIVSHLSNAAWAWDSARQIKAILNALFEKMNELSLGSLGEQMTPTQMRSFLCGLPGVDRELANEVMMLSFNVPVFPCSEGIARMCYRLGVLDTESPSAKNQRFLTKLIAPQYYVPVHLFLTDCSGRTCLPEGPRCQECLVQQWCNWNLNGPSETSAQGQTARS